MHLLIIQILECYIIFLFSFFFIYKKNFLYSDTMDDDVDDKDDSKR